ncbi:MAG: pyridoxamine 5'-phosphate oxidase family protein [Chloracidobacterium sp.]|nr:pyridoxamine 5'-phosphate oxidase family protein [Chloracidobacterium sp.]
MSNKFHELTFTPAVKAAQEHYGTRKAYARFEGGESDFHGLSDAEIDFIDQRDGFYMATVGENGQPYIQFRGGPKGFLKVLDEQTLGFADFRGNLQYISVGNLAGNDKAALFLMDYPGQRRLKVLVRVEVKDAADVPEIIGQLTMPGYKAKIERAMILHVEAFDWNCPQHITPRYTMDEIRSMTAPLHEHIEKLEREIEKLKTNKPDG